MLDQRRRRWASIKTTLVQRPRFLDTTPLFWKSDRPRSQACDQSQAQDLGQCYIFSSASQVISSAEQTNTAATVYFTNEPLLSFIETLRFIKSSQQKRNICITFVQCWTNVVGRRTNVIQMFCVCLLGLQLALQNSSLKRWVELSVNDSYVYLSFSQN